MILPRVLLNVLKINTQGIKKTLLTSDVESHWLRQQQTPALRRKDTGNPECTRFHQSDQTASPKCNKEEEI